jgi:hypothetical protein
MPTDKGAPEPGPAEFERIVSRLRAEDPQFADPKLVSARALACNRPRSGDGFFVTGCLAVIVAMSLIIGGWVGLWAIVTASLVVARMLLQEEANRQRQGDGRAPRRG